MSISFESFKKILASLPNWKAPEFDSIYVLWIKSLINYHERIYDLFIQYLYEPESITDILFIGSTYLIPKANTCRVEDFRPIMCLSNFYKILTKILRDTLYQYIESNNIISFNQAVSLKIYEMSKNNI